MPYRFVTTAKAIFLVSKQRSVWVDARLLRGNLPTISAVAFSLSMMSFRQNSHASTPRSAMLLRHRQ